MATDSNGNYLNVRELGATKPENYNIGYDGVISLDNVCYYANNSDNSYDMGYCAKPNDPINVIFSISQGFNVGRADGTVPIPAIFNQTNNGETIDIILKPNLNAEFEIYNPWINNKNFTTSCACKLPDNTSQINSLGITRSQFNVTDKPVSLQQLSPDFDIQACCFKDGNQPPEDPNNFILKNGDIREGDRYANVPNQNLYDTCAFNLRSMGSKSCVTQFQKYCIPENIGADDLYDHWTGAAGIESVPGWNCYNAFKRIVSSNESYTDNTYDLDGEYAPRPQPVDKGIIQNPTFAINTVEALFSLLQQNKVDISLEQNEANYSNFTSVLYELCNDYPFACKKNLDVYCSNESANTLITTPGNLKWCGCHLPLDAYGKYVDIYGVKKECSPTCHNTIAIPDVQPNVPLKLTDVIGVDFNPVVCKNSNICVIDDINVNLSKNLNITQICGGCQSQNSTCQCIIENDRIISGQNVNISQVCGNDSVYYETQYDPLTGNTTYTNVGGKIFQDTEQEIERTNFGIILGILIIFLAFLALLGYNFGL